MPKNPKLNKKKRHRPNQSSDKSTRKSTNTSTIRNYAVPVAELQKKVINNSPGSIKTPMKKRTFSTKQTKNWKPITESTQDFISGCLETGVNLILNKVINEGQSIDEVQTKLLETVHVIQHQMKSLKAPQKKYGDIKKIIQVQRQTNEQTNFLHDHEEVMEEVVEEEEKAIIECEKELHRLQQTTDEDIELHPLLRNFKPELNIPSLCKR